MTDSSLFMCVCLCVRSRTSQECSCCYLEALTGLTLRFPCWLGSMFVCVCLCVCTTAGGKSDVPVGWIKRYRRIITSLPCHLHQQDRVKQTEQQLYAICCHIHTHLSQACIKTIEHNPTWAGIKIMILIKTSLVHTRAHSVTEMCTHKHTLCTNICKYAGTHKYMHNVHLLIIQVATIPSPFRNNLHVTAWTWTDTEPDQCHTFTHILLWPVCMTPSADSDWQSEILNSVFVSVCVSANAVCVCVCVSEFYMSDSLHFHININWHFNLDWK